jgi:hypothetical protein
MLEAGRESESRPRRVDYRRLRQMANALIRPKNSRRSSSKRIMLDDPPLRVEGRAYHPALPV